MRLPRESELFLAAEKKAMENPAYTLRKVNTETKETLAQLEKDYKPAVSRTEILMCTVYPIGVCDTVDSA